MLQIQHICKEYRTGELVQKALDDVSLNLRDNEFVAILGPSGSGKTTLLNIIGGLDQYDSGELIINGISTQKYKDRDWDSYRNHTIGFVFQSYNLIPHQTLLANVELALTISGVSRAERRQRAVQALQEVGLGDQMHKKHSQLSGGQMQRVAIARALVNNPDILLADEPTGALDSDTSLQVMDLLKDVAKNHLVVMVTHNAELADTYATRIVRLKDGRILSDSDEYVVDTESALAEHRNMGHASMSFLTALDLSFHNLLTKKARTILTAFAGSIGIIGIALILALSNGVSDYIARVEEETLSEYPVQITSTGVNLSSLVSAASGVAESERDAEHGVVHVIQMVTTMFSQVEVNDLGALKSFLDSGTSGMDDYVQAIEYTYNIEPQIYQIQDTGYRQVNPDSTFSSLGGGSGAMLSSYLGNNFHALPENSNLYENQYDVVAGHWPENYDECILVLTGSGGISDLLLYTLGLRDQMELVDMIQQYMKSEEIDTPGDLGTYTYDDILGITFKLVLAADYYQYDSDYEVWTDKSDNTSYMQELVEGGEDLKIVGIVRPSKDATASFLSSGIYYPASLTTHIMEEASDKEIVKAQMASPDINVLTGEEFGTDSQESGFDLSSLLSIDTSALEDMFQADSDDLTGDLSDFDYDFDFSDQFSLDEDSLDLSGLMDTSDWDLDLDLSGISVSLPGLSMDSLLQGVSISVTSETLSGLAEDLVAGYADYAAENPDADISVMGDYFTEYLNSDAAQTILRTYMAEIIASGSDITVSTDQLQSLIYQIMAGYQAYAAANGYTDADLFGDYLQEYMQTAEANAILNAWAAENLQINSDNVTITPAEIQSLSMALMFGYSAYAEENEYPDPSDIGTYLSDYLDSPTAQAIITGSISGMIDTSSLSSQLSSTLSSYISSIASTYGSAVAEQIESQLSGSMEELMTSLTEQIESQLQDILTPAMEDMMGELADTIEERLQGAFSIDADDLTEIFSFVMDSDALSDLLSTMNSFSSSSYDDNLSMMGYQDVSTPDEIDIYPLDFAGKEHVTAILEDYNTAQEAAGNTDKIITYTDMVATLMSSVTDIVNQITYVLIAFVAISLVVSSIMIGVITYISVLERRKEIGILRAIGASKNNVSQVFNAETFIIGLCAGLIGVGLSLLLMIPANMIIHFMAGSNRINASLPLIAALLLIVLSVALTIISGLIPSHAAAKSDPVAALRSE